MIPYKHSNGRIMARSSNGRFRNFTFEEVFGVESNSDYLVCGKCGYGESDPWIPLLKTGRCPECGNQENHIPKVIVLSRAAEDLMDKIDEVKKIIGIDFINPKAFRDYGPKLNGLERELETELRKCIDDSFTNK